MSFIVLFFLQDRIQSRIRNYFKWPLPLTWNILTTFFFLVIDDTDIFKEYSPHSPFKKQTKRMLLIWALMFPRDWTQTLYPCWKRAQVMLCPSQDITSGGSGVLHPSLVF